MPKPLKFIGLTIAFAVIGMVAVCFVIVAFCAIVIALWWLSENPLLMVLAIFVGFAAFAAYIVVWGDKQH